MDRFVGFQFLYSIRYMIIHLLFLSEAIQFDVVHFSKDKNSKFPSCTQRQGMFQMQSTPKVCRFVPCVAQHIPGTSVPSTSQLFFSDLEALRVNTRNRILVLQIKHSDRFQSSIFGTTFWFTHPPSSSSHLNSPNIKKSLENPRESAEHSSIARWVGARGQQPAAPLARKNKANGGKA